MTRRIEEIDGMLTTQGGDVLRVRLAATVAEVLGSTAVEAEEISRLELLTDVPDGEYVLDYFYARPRRDRVCVRFGRFLNRR